MKFKFSKVIGVALGACAAAGSASAQAIHADFPTLIDGGRAARIVPAAAVTAYFDQRVDLGMYPRMIAVFADPAARAQADVPAALAEAGLASAESQPSSVPGWTYVKLAGDGADPALAEQAVLALAAGGRVDMASLVYIGESGLPEIPTRDLLVSFAAGATPEQQEALLAAHGATIMERDAAGSQGLVRARVDAATGAEILEIALSVNDDPAVDWAQSDRIFWARRMGLPPNDPMFGQQWALEQPNDEDMDALDAWAITIGDPSIRVVVLDSGIQQNHPDISQVTGQTFTGSGTNGGPGNSCDNHGTAVAGCVSATINNGIGIVGIAPGARAQSAKIFNEINFFGFCLPFLESQDSWTVAGINSAASSGARVTNSSWGGGVSSAITSAFNSTRAQGVLHFAATGNDGGSSISFPASLASVNAVAALNSSGSRASFSTYGVGLFISAPGAGILTTDRTGSDGYSSGSWATVDGTSFASPYAAGVAALVLSANPALTPAEVEAILAQTAVDKGPAGYDTEYGWGFINAGAAAMAVGGVPCPEDLDGDGVVGLGDLSILLANFGLPGGPEDGDLDGDGEVGLADLSLLLEVFGTPCP